MVVALRLKLDDLALNSSSAASQLEILRILPRFCASVYSSVKRGKIVPTCEIGVMRIQ